MNFVIILNFTLALICIIHISINLLTFLNPENPSVKTYRKNLEDIEFPLIFKICYDFSDDEIFQQYGYHNARNFMFGRSMFNGSIYGWNGHTANGTIMKMPTYGNNQIF